MKLWQTKKELYFGICMVLIIALWFAGLVAPFLFLEPAGFWQKSVFAVFELIWAIISAIVAFIVLKIVAHAIDD